MKVTTELPKSNKEYDKGWNDGVQHERDRVCLEIAGFSPLGHMETKELVKIIRKK